MDRGFFRQQPVHPISCYKISPRPSLLTYSAHLTPQEPALRTDRTLRSDDPSVARRVTNGNAGGALCRNRRRLPQQLGTGRRTPAMAGRSQGRWNFGFMFGEVAGMVLESISQQDRAGRRGLSPLAVDYRHETKPFAPLAHNASNPAQQCVRRFWCGRSWRVAHDSSLGPG